MVSTRKSNPPTPVQEEVRKSGRERKPSNRWRDADDSDNAKSAVGAKSGARVIKSTKSTAKNEDKMLKLVVKTAETKQESVVAAKSITTTVKKNNKVGEELELRQERALQALADYLGERGGESHSFSSHDIIVHIP
jgi:hypothetical protein